jgi:diguanylate cyclase (GGDEF)-like protein
MRANCDKLTGLADRLQFESRLDMAKARIQGNGRSLAVLLLDIDSFKPINDALGHFAGDEILKQFAQRLKSAFRSYDTLARLKDDNFAILIEDLPALADGEIIARKIISLLASPFQFLDRAVILDVSIGIATCTDGQEINCKAIMKQADAAMHDAKLTPGSFFQTFTGLLAHLAEASAAEMVM